MGHREGRLLALVVLAVAVGACGQDEAKREAHSRPGMWQLLSRREADSVQAGLTWLRDHQHPDGYWDGDGFMKQDTIPPICDGAGLDYHDPGLTGLSLLAFLGMGQTQDHGEFKDTVKMGLRYLRSIQGADDCFGPRNDGHFVYSHAISTLAMVEAYGLTGAPHLKQSAQSAIDFIHRAQNPNLAWRYGVRARDNDTSVTGWMVAALHAAKRVGLETTEASFAGARNWLESATNYKTGLVGYSAKDTGPARPEGLLEKWPPSKSESLTAIGILCRMYTGEDPHGSAMIRKGVDRCLRTLPHWDVDAGSIDFYYWYHGSLALFQVGGNSARKWRKAALRAVIDNQRKDPASFQGSWDPAGPWGYHGGRICSTAFATLIVETPARCQRNFGR